MDVDQLRAFVAVARARRFTRAARTLGTTQPSLSRRVQQLERAVGAKLVVRTPAGIVLTSAGSTLLLGHAERALASVDAGRTAIEELTDEARGTVALGSQPTISAYVLPALLARFHAKNPDVVLKLREGLADQIEERVASGELDLALMNLPVRRLDLAAQKQWQEGTTCSPCPPPTASRRSIAPSPSPRSSRRAARRRRRRPRERRRSSPRARRRAPASRIVVDADNLEEQ